jgi:hypothetical protein
MRICKAKTRATIGHRMEWGKSIIRAAAALIAIWCASGLAVACNIPVFRYALERWKPDELKLFVFRDQELEESQKKVVADVRPKARSESGEWNFTIEEVIATGEMNIPQRRAWQAIRLESEPALPHLSLCSRVGPEQWMTAWHSPLVSSRLDWLEPNPSTTELVKRLTSGHSIVWLIVPGKNDPKNEAVRSGLPKVLKSLESTIKIPEGIGLPGSELFSEIPLLIRFSTLELDPMSDHDSRWIKFFRQIRPEQDDAPLLIPVFGKCRALEVIPSEEFQPELIDDLTMYLCGACSCQVKERNPGFDLLVNARWNELIFGEDSEVPPEVTTLAREPSTPRRLSIPPGRKK